MLFLFGVTWEFAVERLAAPDAAAPRPYSTQDASCRAKEKRAIEDDDATAETPQSRVVLCTSGLAVQSQAIGSAAARRWTRRRFA